MYPGGAQEPLTSEEFFEARTSRTYRVAVWSARVGVGLLGLGLGGLIAVAITGAAPAGIAFAAGLGGSSVASLVTMGLFVRAGFGIRVAVGQQSRLIPWMRWRMFKDVFRPVPPQGYTMRDR